MIATVNGGIAGWNQVLFSTKKLQTINPKTYPLVGRGKHDHVYRLWLRWKNNQEL
jgi:hypothetical protein